MIGFYQPSTTGENLTFVGGLIVWQNDEVAVNIIKTIFSVVDEDEFKGHIVVELSDIDNESYVKKVGGDHVETVVAQDVLSRLMIQCARQPGLAQVSLFYVLSLSPLEQLFPNHF